MSGLPGPGALIHTNYDPRILRVHQVVPDTERGGWCFLCYRADDPRGRQGTYIVGGYHLEAGRLLGRRFVPGQAMYHAIVGRDSTGQYRDGGPEVACEVFVVTPERQLTLFP